MSPQLTDEQSRVLSDLLQRVKAVERNNGAVVKTTTTTKASGLTLLPTPVTLASGTTSGPSSYTLANASSHVRGASAVFVQFTTSTSEEECAVYVSPDGQTGYVALASKDPEPGGGGGSQTTVTVPVYLGPDGDFYYKVPNGTANWVSWSIKLVGYFS